MARRWFSSLFTFQLVFWKEHRVGFSPPTRPHLVPFHPKPHPTLLRGQCDTSMHPYSRYGSSFLFWSGLTYESFNFCEVTYGAFASFNVKCTQYHSDNILYTSVVWDTSNNRPGSTLAIFQGWFLISLLEVTCLQAALSRDSLFLSSASFSSWGMRILFAGILLSLINFIPNSSSSSSSFSFFSFSSSSSTLNSVAFIPYYQKCTRYISDSIQDAGSMLLNNWMQKYSMNEGSLRQAIIKMKFGHWRLMRKNTSRALFIFNIHFHLHSPAASNPFDL